jgi:transcriptional regulator with XRE-family HTH domain
MSKVEASIQAKFGAHLQKLRKDKGWSQEQLAYKANLHPTYVSGIERGVRNLSLRNIEKLARALEISLAELFKGLDC